MSLPISAHTNQSWPNVSISLLEQCAKMTYNSACNLFNW